jgi:hypothetical protein
VQEERHGSSGPERRSGGQPIAVDQQDKSNSGQTATDGYPRLVDRRRARRVLAPRLAAFDRAFADRLRAACFACLDSAFSDALEPIDA